MPKIRDSSTNLLRKVPMIAIETTYDGKTVYALPLKVIGGDFLTEALADGLYLRLDTTNDPLTADLDLNSNSLLRCGLLDMTGDIDMNSNNIGECANLDMTGLLTISNTAPTIRFTDTDVGDNDYTMTVDGDNFRISNVDGFASGFIIPDHPIELFPSIPNTAAFTSAQVMLFRPTVAIAPVSNISVIRDLTTATMGGLFSSYSVITAQPVCENINANAGAVYLFVSQGISKSTNALYPPSSYRSYDHRGIIEADGAAVPNCAGNFGLLDIGMCRAVNSGSITVDFWVTAGNSSVPGLGVVSATVGASCTVTDRIVFNANNTNLNGDGGAEAITNQYGFKCGPLTSASAINCGAWIDGTSGAAANYGIVLNSDLADGGAIWFGAGQDAKIYYDGNDLIIDPDIVGSGSVLIGATGNNDMILNDIEINGLLNHDGSSIGFYGVTPVVRPAAYTQTYSTATRTHSNLTSATLTDSTGGSTDDTVAQVTDNSETTNNTTINDNFAELTEEVNALRVDLVNVKGVVNQVIDDLQNNGILQ
jgi:hypothetical protein